MRQILISLNAALCSFAAVPALAQSDGAEQSASFGSEYSLHVGSLLPNQIEGVTEIQPTWGFRYAHSISYGSLEVGYAGSHANGVDYQIASLSYRGDLPAMNDLMAIVYVGPDFHYYKPLRDKRQSVWGLHVGAGVEMHLGGPFWLRSDMKFNMNPGTALYIGFGIAIRTDGTGGE